MSLVLTLASALLAAAFVTYAPGLLLRRLAERRLRRAVRGRLALTYDDGPGPELTARLLELLERRGVRATFFLVGFRAERAPELCARLAAAGHELACHSHAHENAWKTWPWRPVRDLAAGYRTLSKWVAPSAPYRPPNGKLTLWTWLAARRRGSPLAFWTLTSGDTWPQPPAVEAMVERVLAAGGGVVLMHSYDRERHRHQTEYVLALSEALLDAAAQRGLAVCTMSELLEDASRTSS